MEVVGKVENKLKENPVEEVKDVSIKPKPDVKKKAYSSTKPVILRCGSRKTITGRPCKTKVKNKGDRCKKHR